MADEAGFLAFSRLVMAGKGLVPAAHHELLIGRLQEVADGQCDRFTIAPPSISIASVPATTAPGNVIGLHGTVAPGSSGVQIGLSTSATVAPGSWIGATVTAGVWTGSLTPAAAGTVYVWAEQIADTAVVAVSSAISVIAASLSVVAPATGTAASVLTVTGTVSPAGDSVNVELSTQNSALPTSGWTAATNSGGSFSAALMPAASGTYYAWAEDLTTGLTAVSAAITVAAAATLVYDFNNPGGSYVHAVSTIGLNGSVTPAESVPTQVALSTSGTVVPTSGWQPASIIYSNSLWAIYYPTPATAGNYYVWVQTAAGASTAVSSFTVSVT